MGMTANQEIAWEVAVVQCGESAVGEGDGACGGLRAPGPRACQGQHPVPSKRGPRGPGPPVAVGSIFWKARPHRTTSHGPGSLSDGSTRARPPAPPWPQCSARLRPRPVRPCRLCTPGSPAPLRAGRVRPRGSGFSMAGNPDSALAGTARTGPRHGCPHPDRGGRAPAHPVRKTVPDPRNIFQIWAIL